MGNLTPNIHYLIVFIGGLGAGFIGVLVGGCSFFTIPLLIFVGLPPHIAIATNRLGLLGMIFTGGYKYHRQHLIDYKIGFLIGVMALIGSICGAHLMLSLDTAVLKIVIAILSCILLLIIIFQPERGLVECKKKTTKKDYVVGSVLSFALGVYGGFYGAGVGTMLSYMLVLLFGKTFLQSAGTRKIPMLLLSIMATMIFILKGVINYPYALLLFVGMAIGAFVGAHHAKAIGNVWLKKMFLGLALIMVVLLLR
ncbi:sulfite exporter TauE/SafE family protein [Candidatus Omnitrophota bacterium]